MEEIGFVTGLAAMAAGVLMLAAGIWGWDRVSLRLALFATGAMASLRRPASAREPAATEPAEAAEQGSV